MVPSRYALKVGEIDVLVVSDGCYRCQARCWGTAWFGWRPATTGEALVATNLPFPSVCHVAVAGDAFRWVPVTWEY